MNNYKKYLFILILISSIFSQTSIDKLSSKELELIKKQVTQVSEISILTKKLPTILLSPKLFQLMLNLI